MSKKSDVYRRQILTSKLDRRTERGNRLVVCVDDLLLQILLVILRQVTLLNLNNYIYISVT